MNWRTLLVLGGYGETGRRLVRLLVERTDARVVVAGRDSRRATALAAELGADRVRGIGLDAADAPSVRRALEGVDLLVNLAVVPRHVAALARTALATGTDWLDFQIHRGQARILDEMANEIAAAGRCFVTQAGFHPGVPAALVRWAAQRVDELRGAWIASVLAERDGLPATSGLDELVASFRDYRAMRYENGRWQQLAGRRPSDYPVVDFGFGFGRRRTFVMEFDELLPLPDRLPGLRRLGFSITMDAATNVASSLILPALAVTGPRPRAIRAYSRLMAWTHRTFGRPPYGCVVQMDAEGVRGDAPTTVAVRLFHEDGYDLTAIAGESMAEQLIDGSARRPGLHRMGLIVDPERMLADMETMGVRVETDDPALARRPST